MFGASEDRARQLAGRQRWKRISSSGSNSSYRSAGSSSQLSHRETSSIFEQSIQRPTSIPEHHAYNVNDLLCDLYDPRRVQHVLEYVAASGMEETLAQMTAEEQHPHAQQQRIQAEHLSHVLYNERATNEELSPSASCSKLPGQAKSYGALGLGPAISNQLRYVTAPVSPVGNQSTMLSAHSIVNRSTSGNIAHTQTIVSLRGDADDEPIPNNTQPHEATTSHSSTLSWLGLARAHPSWNIKFNIGHDYRTFVDSLSPTQAATFFQLFDSFLNPEPHAFELSRRVFHKQLAIEQRQSFQRMIDARLQRLLDPKLDKILGPDGMIRPHDPLKDGYQYPLVRMPSLVNAMAPVPEEWINQLDPAAVAR
jgi:hypothetical protein